MPNPTGTPILALVSPNIPVYSETFIRAHIDLLDPHRVLLYGGFRPQFSEKEGPLTGQSLLAKVLRRTEEYLTPAHRLTRHERDLAALLRREGVEVMLAEYGIAGAKNWRACADAGVPLVVHFHGFDAYHYPTLKQFGHLYPDMFAYATYIVGVSKHMCQQLVELGAPPEKVVYNTYGPRPDFFSVQPTFAHKNLVAVARFAEKKAPQVTVRAFAKAVEQCPELRLRMGGDGPELPKCQALAHELGVADKIEFGGVLNLEQIKAWFADAYAFVQHSVRPTHGDSEGTPVVILEASAAGLPVLSTRHAGIPDVIVEGKTGILVDEYEEAAFAQSMIYLAQNEDLARQMGAAGKTHIGQHFTLTQHLDGLRNLLRNAATHSKH